MSLRVSNTQRSLYLSCPKKYQFRYRKKLRSRDKGSALFMGTAFDQASDVLFHEGDLEKAKAEYSNLWLAHESNLSCKFSKTDLDIRIYQSSDISKLESIADNLNHSKAKGEYGKDGDVIKLLKSIKKMKDSSFMRDLTNEEEQFHHYAHILCMDRKGHLMLEAFYKDILPHITESVSTQLKVDIKNPGGDTIIGYIDLLCKMSGYVMPNGRVLTDEDLIVADVKTAGAMFWKKLDDIDKSDQLDIYLISPQVQELAPTNLIAYMAVSKIVSKDETMSCKSCSHVKESSHKTCNNTVEGKRCGGDWEGEVRYYCDSKIVISERNVEEANQILNDYDDVLHGIKQQVFPRNREHCNAYGGICEYADICGKCFSSPEKEAEALEDWKVRKGEKRGK